MKRILVMIFLFGILLSARVGSADAFVDKMFAKEGFAGLIFRPVVCLSECDGVITTFGLEAGYKFIGFSLRYGRKDKVNHFYPDIRGYYDIQVTRHLVVTPMIEFTPAIFNVKGGNGIDLILRPGVRVGYAPKPYLLLVVEPLAFDFGLYHKVFSDSGSAESSKFTVGYTFGFAVQTRF